MEFQVIVVIDATTTCWSDCFHFKSQEYKYDDGDTLGWKGLEQ